MIWTKERLWTLFAELNEYYFDNKVQITLIEIAQYPQERAAADFCIETKVITFYPLAFAQQELTIEEIMYHEMCHALYPGDDHGQHFQRELANWSDKWIADYA